MSLRRSASTPGDLLRASGTEKTIQVTPAAVTMSGGSMS